MANFFTGTRQNRLRFVFSLVILLLAGSMHGQGFQIYLVKVGPDLSESANCHYCFELTNQVLFDTPMLDKSDIDYFDWENQIILLKPGGRSKINKLKIPLHGLAAAIVMDGKPIYGFWLWNVVSSFDCDRVYTYPTMNFKLEFGLPFEYANGEDPRFDNRIKMGLIRDGLAK